jgi:hypothetical protein
LFGASAEVTTAAPTATTTATATTTGRNHGFDADRPEAPDFPPVGFFEGFREVLSTGFLGGLFDMSANITGRLSESAGNRGTRGRTEA